MKPIEMRGLTIGYDGRIMVEDVDLDVNEGDFLAIIGPNGGGKSTLLKGILGLLTPIHGTVTVMGEPPTQGRRYVGYIPQHSSFDARYPISVREVVMMGKRRDAKGLWFCDDDRKDAIDALESVGMADHVDRHIDRLSGGQRQKVFLARALVGRPKILLLDEPTANVDKRSGVSIYDLLRELNREVTIVLVTHDIGAVSSYVNRIACLNRKLIVHDEPLITPDMLDMAYSCPVDLIAHGVPHRMLDEH